MITDIQGTILYVNKAWEEIYGFSREEVIGKTPRVLRSGIHDKDFYQVMWAQILDPRKGYWKGEVTNRTKAGEMVPVLLTISPYRDDNKALLGYMSLGVDIREKNSWRRRSFGRIAWLRLGCLPLDWRMKWGRPSA